MSERYFVIHGNEDGEASLQEYTKNELLKQLTPNEYGEVEIDPKQIFSKLGKGYTDVGELGGYLIIKGEIVVPKPKRTVVEFELP